MKNKTDKNKITCLWIYLNELPAPLSIENKFRCLIKIKQTKYLNP